MSHPRTPPTGTLLGIWAHPDDDAFLSAALMARARQAGERVVVATATRGEQGTAQPAAWPPDRLAAHSEQEQRRSLAALGVTEHRWLGHHDGDLPAVRRSAAVEQVAAIIDEVRPDTIVTFGPDGMTGHADHRTVSSWVTRAWRDTGRTSRLWYATLTPTFHRTWGRLSEELGIWYDGAQPPTTPEEELAAQVVCDDELSDLKDQALRAHASQIDGLVALLGPDRFRSWWAVESFVAAR
jgi:LmbE family N-acetylglucosaminyl deacetylase